MAMNGGVILVLPVWTAHCLKRQASFAISHPWRAACFQGIENIFFSWRIKYQILIYMPLLSLRHRVVKGITLPVAYFSYFFSDRAFVDRDSVDMAVGSGGRSCSREWWSYLVHPLQSSDGLRLNSVLQPRPHPHPCHRHGFTGAEQRDNIAKCFLILICRYHRPLSAARGKSPVTFCNNATSAFSTAHIQWFTFSHNS